MDSAGLSHGGGYRAGHAKAFEKGHRTPIPVVRAAIFAVLEMAGVGLQDGGKRLGVSIRVRGGEASGPVPS